MRVTRGWMIGLLLIVLLVGTTGTAAAAGKTDQPNWQGKAIRGEVIAVAPPTLTVQTPGGPVVVVTGEGTRFRVPGVGNATLSDIEVGDYVVCLGRRGAGVFRAGVVAVVEPEARFDRVGGQVVSVDGSDITINTLSGESVVIHTDADTVFRIPGIEDPGPDDIEVGSVIGAAGRRGEDGVFYASLVVVPRKAQRQGRVNGEVAGIEGTTLIFQTRGGRQVRLLTDEATAFHVPGVENPSLDDVHVGDRVTVQVQMREGVLYAAVVVVWPERPARLAGEVTAVEGSTLTLETPRGTVRVLTDSSTIFRVRGVENASLDDVRVGDRVVCGGTWEDEGAFRASVVVVPRGRTGHG